VSPPSLAACAEPGVTRDAVIRESCRFLAGFRSNARRPWVGRHLLPPRSAPSYSGRYVVGILPWPMLSACAVSGDRLLSLRQASAMSRYSRAMPRQRSAISPVSARSAWRSASSARSSYSDGLVIVGSPDPSCHAGPGRRQAPDLNEVSACLLEAWNHAALTVGQVFLSDCSCTYSISHDTD